jgi:MFS family permease
VLLLFFVNGASFSSWLPRVPEVRDRLDLSLGELGTVLLAVGLGGLVSSAVGGVVVDRLGSRRASVGASILLAGGLPLIGMAPSAVLLAGALLCLSAVDAVADIAMNVQAADVQRRLGRSIIQRFHAGWSIGTVTGAAAGTAAAALEVSLTVQLVATGAVLAALVLWARPALATDVEPPPPAQEGVRRSGAVLLLAGLAVLLALVEGTPGDWAAVFADDVHDASEGIAGLGYVAVAAGMVVGRLAGDRAADHFGGPKLFRLALTVAGVGAFVVVTSPHVAVVIVGFAVTGCGISVLFPALYLQAATTPGVPAGLGLGVMASGARCGFLVSPVTVGAISEATTLRVGISVVIGGAALGALLLGRVAGRMSLRTAADR